MKFRVQKNQTNDGIIILSPAITYFLCQQIPNLVFVGDRFMNMKFYKFRQ